MKKLIAVLLCFTLVATLTACNGQEKTPEATTEATEVVVPETKAPTEAPVEAPQAQNTKKPVTIEKFTEVVEAELAVLSDEEHQGYVTHGTTSELTNGLKFEKYFGKWYYECDGEEGIGPGDEIAAELSIFSDASFEDLLALATEGYSEEDLKAAGFEQGDNWYLTIVNVGVGAGVEVLVDNTCLRVYGNADYDYIYEMIEKFVG